MMVHESTWFQHLMLHSLCGDISDSLLHSDGVISMDLLMGMYGFFVCSYSINARETRPMSSLKNIEVTYLATHTDLYNSEAAYKEAHLTISGIQPRLRSTASASMPKIVDKLGASMDQSQRYKMPQH